MWDLTDEELAAHPGEDREEVALALACAKGHAGALAVFERDYLDVVPSALAGMKLDKATVEDLRSATREKLLPKLVEYAGRGRLRGLVQVAATRLALDHVRRERKQGALSEQLAAPGDLELSLIKAQYREAFVVAFRAAVAGLAQRDRNLMNLHFLGGVTLERLAAMYDVNRATIVRWLAAARAAVLAATREGVADAIGAPKSELDEMFALVASRVELSVERLMHVSSTGTDT